MPAAYAITLHYLKTAQAMGAAEREERRPGHGGQDEVDPDRRRRVWQGPHPRRRTWRIPRLFVPGKGAKREQRADGTCTSLVQTSPPARSAASARRQVQIPNDAKAGRALCPSAVEEGQGQGPWARYSAATRCGVAGWRSVAPYLSTHSRPSRAASCGVSHDHSAPRARIATQTVSPCTCSSTENAPDCDIGKSTSEIRIG